MDDLISRQNACNEIREYITEPSISDDESEIICYNDGIELAISILSTMPSAQKKGKWVNSTIDGKIVPMKDGSPVQSCWCSECGDWLGASDEYAVKGNFCPNCGADMRGESDG